MSESKVRQNNKDLKDRRIVIEASENYRRDDEHMTVGDLKIILSEYDDDIFVDVSLLTGSGYSCEWLNNNAVFKVSYENRETNKVIKNHEKSLKWIEKEIKLDE